MSIYLPIAQMSVSIFTLLAAGCAVGFLSGLFGVGGGFIMTPLLILMGIPPAVAVGTGSAQIVAASLSGALAQYRRNNVDVTMGLVLLAGGLLGTVLGVQTVAILRRSGQFDQVVALAYVTFLGTIGTLMLLESLTAIRKIKRDGAKGRRSGTGHTWLDGLPFKMRFHRSKLYISAVPPFIIGAFVGVLAAVMGIGGGFVVVPALIYLLRVPTNIAVGTSLFQVVFVSAATTILQAAANQTVDVALALFLVVGGVIGAQIGAVAGERLAGEHLRLGLAALVLLVGLRLGHDLIATPTELFSLQPLERGQE
jgi:uncharacterized protein